MKAGIVYPASDQETRVGVRLDKLEAARADEGKDRLNCRAGIEGTKRPCGESQEEKRLCGERKYIEATTARVIF